MLLAVDEACGFGVRYLPLFPPRSCTQSEAIHRTRYSRSLQPCLLQQQQKRSLVPPPPPRFQKRDYRKHLQRPNSWWFAGMLASEVTVYIYIIHIIFDFLQGPPLQPLLKSIVYIPVVVWSSDVDIRTAFSLDRL